MLQALRYFTFFFNSVQKLNLVLHFPRRCFGPAFTLSAFSGLTYSGPAFLYPRNLVSVHFNILITLLYVADK